MDPRALASELLVDAFGCAPAALTDRAGLERACNALVDALGVVVIGAPAWHSFAATSEGPGGVTALYLLSESHLAVHTWPERGAALISISCCRPLVDDDVVRAVLTKHLGARDVRTSRHARGVP